MAPTPPGVSVAVIPAAGLGTRFLPASKVVPKEMSTLVDRPVLQYVVAEAARAGCSDVLLVTARGKEAMEDHFDAAPELEASLSAKGKDALLEAVRATSQVATVHGVRQHEARGLGHAVGCAAAHVGDRPFAVLLGDDVIDERDHLLERLVEVREQRGGSVVALLEVPEDQTQLYGVATVEATEDSDVVRVTDLVEKPDPGDAPSNLAIIGRYVLDPSVFSVLEGQETGAGGEVQLTDALLTLAGRDASQGGGVHGVVFRGRRYDTGAKDSYLQAVVEMAAARTDLGPAFRSWLQEFVAGLDDAEAPGVSP